MSRQQMIDTYFWDDPWIVRSSPAQRYLFLYLLTNPLTNLAGIYEITDERITRDTKLTIEDIHALFEDFRLASKVYRWADYVVMRNWPKRQNIGSPKVQRGIERILLALPGALLEYLSEIDYRYPQLQAVILLKRPALPAPRDEDHPLADTVSEGHGYGIDTISHLTTPHFTSLHNTPPIPDSKNESLDKLLGSLKTTIINEAGER